MVQDMKPMILNDWVTTPQNPLHSILTARDDILPHYHLFYEIVYIIDGSIRHSVNGMERMLHPDDHGILESDRLSLLLPDTGYCVPSSGHHYSPGVL